MAISLITGWLCLEKRYQYLDIRLELIRKKSDVHVHKYLVFLCFERRKPTALKPVSAKYDVGKARK